MMTTATPHLALCDALVRLISTLVPLVSSTKENDHGLRYVAQEVARVAAGSAGSVPADALEFLKAAQAHLAFPTYVSCTAALASLTAALHALAASSPVISAAQRMPVELFHRIVKHCQTLEHKERQKLNINLAKTCRSLHSALQPILRSELSITTARQLDTLARQVLFDTSNRSLDGVRSMRIDLAVDDLKLREDGPDMGWWPGRYFAPFLDRAMQCAEVKIQLRPSTTALADSDAERVDNMELLQAVGIDSDKWAEYYNPASTTLKSLQLPLTGLETACEFFKVIFDPPSGLRELRIDSPHHVPPETLSGEIAEALRQVVDEKTVDHSSLTTLSIPFHILNPADFLFILRPAPATHHNSTPPRLEHLEVCFNVEDYRPGIRQALDNIFRVLAPSIRHLSLRLRSTSAGLPDPQVADSFWDALGQSLSSCTQLESLEFGAEIPPEGDFMSNLAALPLRSLTLLHLRFNAAWVYSNYLTSLAADSPLQTLTFALHPVHPFDMAAFPDGWNMEDFRKIGELCDKTARKVEMKLEVRHLEAEWWAMYF